MGGQGNGGRGLGSAAPPSADAPSAGVAPASGPGRPGRAADPDGPDHHPCCIRLSISPNESTTAVMYTRTMRTSPSGSCSRLSAWARDPLYGRGGRSDAGSNPRSLQGPPMVATSGRRLARLPGLRIGLACPAAEQPACQGSARRPSQETASPVSNSARSCESPAGWHPPPRCHAAASGRRRGDRKPSHWAPRSGGSGPGNPGRRTARPRSRPRAGSSAPAGPPGRTPPP